MNGDYGLVFLQVDLLTMIIINLISNNSEYAYFIYGVQYTVTEYSLASFARFPYHFQFLNCLAAVYSCNAYWRRSKLETCLMMFLTR